MRHKGSGQGVVTLGGRDVYCGVWPAGLKSPPADVEDRYRRAVSEWLAAGFAGLGSSGSTGSAVPTPHPRPAPILTVNEVLAAFLGHAQTYYVRGDGRPTSQFNLFKLVMKTVRRLYGTTPATTFGPVCLKTVREDFIRQGMSRGVVNSFTSKVRSIFRWAAGNEMIPGAVVHSLECVTGLRPGRSEAREPLPVSAPDDAVMTAVIDAMPAPLRQLATVLRHCGARCGEVLIMRPADIDRTADVWVYAPVRHKGTWRGKPRTIFLGATCQAALRPLLEGIADTDFIFSPRRAEAARLAAIAAGRKTPKWPSHMKRNAMKRKAKRKRPPGEKYDTNTVARQMKKAAVTVYSLPAPLARLEGEKGKAWRERIGPAGVEKVEEHARQFWPHPHVLRHAYGTRVRQALGLDFAEKALGHSSLAMAHHYSKASDSLAREAAAKLG